jgi:hypothetical protein
VTSANSLFNQNKSIFRTLLPEDTAEMIASRLTRAGINAATDADAQRFRTGLVRSADALARNRGLRRFPASDALKNLVEERLDRRLVRKARRAEGGRIDSPSEQEVLRLLHPDS